MSKEKSPNIYQRINAVMKMVSYIEKLDKKVNTLYRFVSHDQVTGLLHKPLTENGIVMVPTVVNHKIEGTRTEITINVRFVNMDEPTDFVEISYIGYGIDSADKGPGKAISYATKYALLKMFCLETGDDPDQDVYISSNQINELNMLLDLLSKERKEFFLNSLIKRFKDPKLTMIPIESYELIKKSVVNEIKPKEEVLNEQVG